MVREKLQRKREDERRRHAGHIGKGQRLPTSRPCEGRSFLIRNEDRTAVSGDHFVHVRHSLIEAGVAGAITMTGRFLSIRAIGPCLSSPAA